MKVPEKGHAWVDEGRSLPIFVTIAADYVPLSKILYSYALNAIDECAVERHVKNTQSAASNLPKVSLLLELEYS